MTPYTITTAYVAVRILLKSGHPTLIAENDLRSAERELIGLIPPGVVTILEPGIAAAAHEYNSRLQAAKYAAVCP